MHRRVHGAELLVLILEYWLLLLLLLVLVKLAHVLVIVLLLLLLLLLVVPVVLLLELLGWGLLALLFVPIQSQNLHLYHSIYDWQFAVLLVYREVN